MKTCKQLAAEWEYWNVPLCSVQKYIKEQEEEHQGKKMQEVPLYSRPVKVLAIPLFWASNKNALLRANTKPPVQLVVVDLLY